MTTNPPNNSTAGRRVRLQKFLSDAGVASRRHAEELIRAGRVLVNDQVVDELPAFVDPATDRVIADGVPVRAQRLEYFLVHKPKNVVCTNRDPAGRVRAIDLLPNLPVRLFPVGRLDADSTGLLLMTNDGELAERLTHPRYGVPKTYRAEVRGRVPADLPARLLAGVHLAEGKARADQVEVIHAAQDRSALLITLREGRNRQIRRMLARLGYPVKSLKRVQIGPLSLKGLPIGAARRLTSQELAALRAAVEHSRSTTAANSRRGGARSTDVRRRTTVKKGRDSRARDQGTGPPRRIIT